jgi:asparagine synthase (glutamine-hydrolysing)
MDGAALFDWVGRLQPPEPIADLLVGPFLDQLSRVTGHSAVVLTGYDGDTLLRSAFRLHWKQRLARGELAALARELAWYVRTQRALPPIGVRTFFAQRRRAPIARPRWLREAFWTSARLEQRWSSGTASPDVSGPRDPAVRGMADRSWGPFFDAHDAANLGRAVEFRHPLLDLRLVRFVLGLPAVPWCVDKHLFRRCLGDLPAEIRHRPKAPLARDPVVELIRRRGLASLADVPHAEALAPFVDLRAAREALRATSEPNDETWLALRAVGLALWLRQRDAAPSAAGVAC